MMDGLTCKAKHDLFETLNVSVLCHLTTSPDNHCDNIIDAQITQTAKMSKCHAGQDTLSFNWTSADVLVEKVPNTKTNHLALSHWPPDCCVSKRDWSVTDQSAAVLATPPCSYGEPWWTFFNLRILSHISRMFVIHSLDNAGIKRIWCRSSV